MQFGGPVTCSNTSAPVQLSLSSAAISFVLGIITSPANLLICLVVAKDPNKNLRTPFNLFIVNIAIADLLVGSVVLPLSVAFHVCESMGLFYPQLIKVLHMSVFTSCAASALAICSLSFDRYIAITSPLKYRTRLNSSRVKKTTGLIWTSSVLMSLLYFGIDFITYAFVYVNVIILFSGTVLAFVHCRVSHALRPRVLAASSINRIILRQIRGITTERNAKVTKAFFTLLFVFFCCNFPSFIIIYTLNFCQVCDCVTIHVLRDFGFLSLLVSSAINPFYYGFRLPHFKTALRKLWVIYCRQSRAEGIFCDSTLSENQANELRCCVPNQNLQFNILRSRRYSGLSELQNPTKKSTTPNSLPTEARPLFTERYRKNKGQAIILTRFRLNTL